MIYVVDSADKERIEIAKQELEMMLQEEELKGVPVLVLANKQDQPNALNDQEVRGFIIGMMIERCVDMQWVSIDCN